MPESSYFNLENEEVLKVLREIKESPELTQREIATRLGISVGKANFLIKSLIGRGFVKASNFKNSNNKVSYLYVLTPQGMEAKARATYRFLRQKMEEYERLQAEIQRLAQEVRESGIPPDTSQ
jgi:EPS-associated MarR family transcriptional regulator